MLVPPEVKQMVKKNSLIRFCRISHPIKCDMTTSTLVIEHELVAIKYLNGPRSIKYRKIEYKKELRI